MIKRRKLKRNYKDSIFRTLFNDEEKLRELYNALEGTELGDDVPIFIETLENALFVDASNDLAFRVGNKFVVLIEHQSTLCPNMPYRMLGYTARTFERMYSDVNFFSTKQHKLIVPEFYVLYNGPKSLPDESIIRLSDCYVANPPENSVEIIVKVLDVGYNKDKEILKRSPTLHDYSKFIQILRETMSGRVDKEAAAAEAVKKCLKEGILADFLKIHGAEATNMAFAEFNHDEYIEQLKKDYYEDGLTEGRAEGNLQGKAESILEILSELGEVPSALKRRILEQQDLNILKIWLKLAVKAASISEFEAKIF